MTLPNSAQCPWCRKMFTGNTYGDALDKAANHADRCSENPENDNRETD